MSILGLSDSLTFSFFISPDEKNLVKMSFLFELTMSFRIGKPIHLLTNPA